MLQNIHGSYNHDTRGEPLNETALMMWIHGHSSPVLDQLFIVSHQLGTYLVLAVVALPAIAWHARRGEKRAVRAWLLVSLATLLLTFGVKHAVARPRPQLWPRIVPETDFSFPSGHALATAAIYPLLAWTTLRLRRGGFGLLGIGLPLFVGFGRLYLGVHWPTDVLAGWVLGAALAAAAIASIRPGTLPPP
jgi:undecaprenyl-diphosphatase